MKLTVLERFYLLALLPKNEDINILKIVRDLKNSLALTEEEYKEFEVKVEDGKTNWNIKGTEEREIQIGEKATDVCMNALKEANKNKLLTELHIDLYDKFVK
jgi:ribonuclease HII